MAMGTISSVLPVVTVLSGSRAGTDGLGLYQDVKGKEPYICKQLRCTSVICSSKSLHSYPTIIEDGRVCDLALKQCLRVTTGINRVG